MINIQFYASDTPNDGSLLNNNNFQPLKRHTSLTNINSPPKRQHCTEPNSNYQTDEDDRDDEDEEDGDNSNTGSINGVGSAITNGNKDGHVTNGKSIKRDDNRRRAAHTAAEQKRRNAIRKGYDALQSLVPNSHLLDPISSQKVSKAAILKRSTDYLQQLHEEKQKLNHQLEALRNEAFCLRTMQKTYEDIVKMNMNSSKHARDTTLDDEHKFTLFQNIADSIFVSFDQAVQTVSMPSCQHMMNTILRWVEESCRPPEIHELVRRQVQNFRP
ncbi:unnamed protein product [Didymodactylos carnosus]|uniref:BHLH domain-containing protein n=1 Tax=Didymodactylos carnosus TaxID=1234261 RepID=A0A8S2T574_9BILA|nr:unnamed protein product [Didymodactylos carnosus]CAF4270077.1 unnamed protein product [Didymodactylos carnosus]